MANNAAKVDSKSTLEEVVKPKTEF
jgi:ABC-type multidrug transport system fused ATPase/permease subunit